ncbi:hypothetical protein PR202_gb16529 [Eleusine coracana subsp. coracana]|uniref:Late embryogenesis abundant protein LEA-2 subgroup domain-containing protein n=1 Tax=Eleusine coracana subsp. coracana TaxID=191504 RepID=A0AAV5F2B8_ELECO|nr:hypothetical protein QOZ80_9BG0697010 [Eleusine coracana subsp. coracana]GJN28411.1 hypothetical protein PR202_gb16529 [Eleusine coracana subsp. coracana]
MADRVHPTPPPPPPEAPHQQQPDATAAATETTPLQEQEQHPSFNRPPAPAPGTYIIQIPKDQVLRVPPPDRARRYAKLAARPARRRRLRRACCLAFSALLLLLLLFAAFAGAVYLVFRPQAPSFSVASLSITNLTTLSFTNNLTALSSSPSSSPAIVVADVRADNTRNKKAGIEYRGGGEVRVAYAGAVLAWGPWPAFRQPPRNMTAFKASLTGNGGVRLTEEQRRQLGREEAARAVPMTVEATVPVRVRLGKVVRTWTVDVRATCHVDVDRMDGTPAAVEDRGCRVRVKPLWWWW